MLLYLVVVSNCFELFGCHKASPRGTWEDADSRIVGFPGVAKYACHQQSKVPSLWESDAH